MARRINTSVQSADIRVTITGSDPMSFCLQSKRADKECPLKGHPPVKCTGPGCPCDEEEQEP